MKSPLDIPELLTLIFDYIEPGDRDGPETNTLLSCLFVNRKFHAAAIKKLWEKSTTMLCQSRATLLATLVGDSIRIERAPFNHHSFPSLLEMAQRDPNLALLQVFANLIQDLNLGGRTELNRNEIEDQVNGTEVVLYRQIFTSLSFPKLVRLSVHGPANAAYDYLDDELLSSMNVLQESLEEIELMEYQIGRRVLEAISDRCVNLTSFIIDLGRTPSADLTNVSILIMSLIKHQPNLRKVGIYNTYGLSYAMNRMLLYRLAKHPNLEQIVGLRATEDDVETVIQTANPPLFPKVRHLAFNWSIHLYEGDLAVVSLTPEVQTLELGNQFNLEELYRLSSLRSLQSLKTYLGSPNLIQVLRVLETFPPLSSVEKLEFVILMMDDITEEGMLRAGIRNFMETQLWRARWPCLQCLTIWWGHLQGYTRIWSFEHWELRDGHMQRIGHPDRPPSWTL